MASFWNLIVGKAKDQPALFGEDLQFAVRNLGRDKVTIRVVGEGYANSDGSSRQKAVSRARVGASLQMAREPQNKWDANAIKVVSDLGQIGYVPREVAEALSPVLDRGVPIEARVSKVDGWFFSARRVIWMSICSPSATEPQVSIGTATASRKMSNLQPIPERLVKLGGGKVQRLEVLGENGHNEDGASRQQILEKVRAGDPVKLVRQPGNLLDPNTIAVFVAGGQVGSLNVKTSKALAAKMDDGLKLVAEISEVRGGTPDKPSRGIWLFAFEDQGLTAD